MGTSIRFPGGIWGRYCCYGSTCLAVVAFPPQSPARHELGPIPKALNDTAFRRHGSSTRTSVAKPWPDEPDALMCACPDPSESWAGNRPGHLAPNMLNFITNDQDPRPLQFTTPGGLGAVALSLERHIDSLKGHRQVDDIIDLIPLVPSSWLCSRVFPAYRQTTVLLLWRKRGRIVISHAKAGIIVQYAEVIEFLPLVDLQDVLPEKAIIHLRPLPTEHTHDRTLRGTRPQVLVLDELAHCSSWPRRRTAFSLQTPLRVAQA